MVGSVRSCIARRAAAAPALLRSFLAARVRVPRARRSRLSSSRRWRGGGESLSRATDGAGRDDRQTSRARRSRARARIRTPPPPPREEGRSAAAKEKERRRAARTHTHAGAFHSLGACRRTRQKNTAVTKSARARARAKERTTAAAAGAAGKEKRALWLVVVERGGRGPERTRRALRKNRGSKYLRARRRRRAFGDGQAVCACCCFFFFPSFCSSVLPLRAASARRYRWPAASLYLALLPRLFFFPYVGSRGVWGP